MRALRSAPIGLVFFLLTLTYIEVGNTEITRSSNLNFGAVVLEKRGLR